MSEKKNKQDVVTEIVKKLRQLRRETGKKEATKKEVNEFIDAFLDVLAENFADGNDINFTNFGKFEIIETKERAGVNPQNPAEHIVIPAYRRVQFKPSKFLKLLVKGEAEV